jgi:hypothetical protein
MSRATPFGRGHVHAPIPESPLRPGARSGGGRRRSAPRYDRLAIESLRTPVQGPWAGSRRFLPRFMCCWRLCVGAHRRRRSHPDGRHVLLNQESGSPEDTDLERNSLRAPRIKHLAPVVRDREWCPDAITNSLCVNRVRVSQLLNTAESVAWPRCSGGHPLLRGEIPRVWHAPSILAPRGRWRVVLSRQRSGAGVLLSGTRE